MKSFLTPTIELSNGTTLVIVDSTRSYPITKEIKEMCKKLESGCEMSIEEVIHTMSPILCAMTDW